MDDKLSLLFWHYAKDFYREALVYARFIEVNRFKKQNIICFSLWFICLISSSIVLCLKVCDWLQNIILEWEKNLIIQFWCTSLN